MSPLSLTTSPPTMKLIVWPYSTPEPFGRLYNQGYIQAYAFTDSRGVYVPADVERMLLGSRNMAEASVGHLMLIFERLTTFAGEIGIPEDRLGVNVEYINSRDPRNVRAAFELAEEFGRILGVKA